MSEILERGTVSQRTVPVDRAQIDAAIAQAGLSHSAVARELVVPLRTWMRWMEKGEIPAGHITNVALLLGLPEPDAGVNVPRTPWVVLRRVEDLVDRLDLVEEQLRQVQAARDRTQPG